MPADLLLDLRGHQGGGLLRIVRQIERRGIAGEVLWKVQAYRLALYLGACVELDTRSLGQDGRFALTVGQLVRAAGSIGANIAEGYPRQSARDRVRFYEYALGSAAEVKVWYMSAHRTIAGDVLEERFAVLRSIARLLQTMIRSARHPTLSSTRASMPNEWRSRGRDEE